MTYRKVDLNQAEIVHGLRKIGATVASTASVGKDFPDIVVGYNGCNYLFEIKRGRSKLTSGQAEFYEDWRGQMHIIRSLDEALDIILDRSGRNGRYAEYAKRQ